MDGVVRVGIFDVVDFFSLGEGVVAWYTCQGLGFLEVGIEEDFEIKC